MAEKKKVPAVAVGAGSDRKKALETALEQIEKQYGAGAVMRLGENVAMNVDENVIDTQDSSSCSGDTRDVACALNDVLGNLRSNNESLA